MRFPMSNHNRHPLHRALAAGAFACAFSFAMPGFAQNSASPIPTAVVKAQAMGASFELDGVVQAVKQSTLSAQASGRIATLLVKAGDKVRAGQLLATIDDREAVTGVQRAGAQVAQAEAETRNAQINFDRAKDLKAKGFVSQSALDTADVQLKSATAMLTQARAGAAASGLAQGFTKVTAPYDGWVLQTHAEAGDLAMPGKPLVTVYAPQPLRAVVSVPASRQPAAKAATQTEVLWGDAPAVAPLVRTAVPSADPVSQTTEWRLDLPSKESSDWLPGQQVRVRFLQAAAAAAPERAKMLVPSAAIVRRGELTAVYVQSNGAFSLRAVRLGANQGSNGVEILAGLKDGDVVALDPIRAGFAKPTAAAK